MKIYSRWFLPLLIMATTATLLGGAGCGDDKNEAPNVTCEQAPDTGADIERSPRCTLVSQEGWDPTTDIPDQQARAGKVREDTRPFHGPEARCGQDDWIMENDYIRVCISGDSSNQLFFTGGRLIDIEDPQIPNHEFFEFAGTLSGLSEVTGDTIELISDGRGGHPAVIRVSGIDMPLKLEIGSLGAGVLGASVGAEFVTEYRLGPESKTLEVVTWIETTQSLFEHDFGVLMFPGDTADYYSIPTGLGKPSGGQEIDIFASVEDVSSVGVYFDPTLSETPPKVSPTSGLLGQLVSSLLAVSLQSVSISPGEQEVIRRWYAVGGPNTTDITQDFQELDVYPDVGVPKTEVTLQADNKFAQKAKWTIENASGTAFGIVSTIEGSGSISLPSGDYIARPVSWPAISAAEVSFAVPDTSSVDLPMPDAGWVKAEVSDGNESPIPAKLRLSGPQDILEYDKGVGTPFAVPAGTWDIEVSMGEEYERVVVEDVVVTTGEETSFSATLQKVMDTTAWVSGDMHQHANRSPDSETPAVRRVMANLIAGVDFFAPSDHDMIEDFAGIMDMMGVSDQMHLFQGQEISPVRAHMNAFPMPYVHSATAGGAVPLAKRLLENPREGRQLTQPEMAAEARARGAEIIQLNHARGGSLPFLDTVGYDPVTGEPTKNPEQWFTSFESMEIMNEEDNTCVLMRDWFSMLRHGMKVTGVGNSDTHDIQPPSGFPRNYIFVGEEQETNLTNQALVEGLNNQQVSVSGNVFIDFTDGTLPGDTIDNSASTDGTYTANLRIQSPAWTGPDTLVTYVNGLEVDRQTIATPPSETINLDEAIDIPLTEDSFIVFMAFSYDTMSDVTPGKHPFGFTNPIYVDVDGNGYEAPGVSGEADLLDPATMQLPWCGNP